MSAFSTKQRILTEHESRGSLEAWCEQLLYHISNEDKFERYLEDLKTWCSVASGIPHRGFITDEQEVNGKRFSAEKKAINLKVLLGFISIHAPVVSSTFVKEEAHSIDEIFDRLRQYYDCRKSGTTIMNMFKFKCGANETREALWERCYSFMEDSLITKSSAIKHCGSKLENDECLTPTLQNITVMIWLDAIHRELPSIVKQRFAITLRDSTLYSIRVEISDAIPSLLQEIGDREGNIAYSSINRSRRSGNQRGRLTKRPKCCLCNAANRPGAETHYFQNCPFMPTSDRRFLRSKITDIEILSESEEEDEDFEYHEPNSRMVRVKQPQNPKINKVDIVSSPCMEVETNKENSIIILDTGAETNLIRKSEARRLKLNILPTIHKANMADGVSPMEIEGEVHFNVSRKCPITNQAHCFRFDGLVVKDLNCAILGGMPFMDRNDVYLRANTNHVYLGDCCDFKYLNIKRHANVKAATILRVPRQTCLLPGSSVALSIPPEYQDKIVSVEPRCNNNQDEWIQCELVKPDHDIITLTNKFTIPILIKRHEQVCQIRHTTQLSLSSDTLKPTPIILTNDSKQTDRSAEISVDPSNILSQEEKTIFFTTNKKYNQVFSPVIGCYNGRSGNFQHRINVAVSLPPQRKGRIPLYNRTNLERLQTKIDELYEQGVFVRPEDINITAEYVNPSFLVTKPSGGFWLVTAFTELSQYTKPQPALMPKVDDIIRHIAQFKFLIKTDLSQAYFQIPLTKSSMKCRHLYTIPWCTCLYQSSDGSSRL